MTGLLAWADDVWSVYSTVVEFTLINIALALSTFAVMSCGLFSVAGAAFMAIGAYTSAILSTQYDQPLLVGLVAGAALSMLIAVAIARLVLHLRSHYLAITTLGLVMILYTLIINAEDLTGGVLGIKGLPLTTEPWHLFLFVAILIHLFDRLGRSRVGRAWRAIRQDEDAAASMGIDVRRYKTLAFVLSAPIAAMAGTFHAHLIGFVDPNAYSFGLMLNLLAYCVLGGTGHWAGPILGATILTLLPEVLRPLAAARDILSGTILVLARVYLPRGLIDPRWIARKWARRPRETARLPEVP